MAKRERCPLTVKHEPHEWYRNNTFRTECPGIATSSRAKTAARAAEKEKQ